LSSGQAHYKISLWVVQKTHNVVTPKLQPYILSSRLYLKTLFNLTLSCYFIHWHKQKMAGFGAKARGGRKKLFDDRAPKRGADEKETARNQARHERMVAHINYLPKERYPVSRASFPSPYLITTHHNRNLALYILFCVF
jgi:hypothetical protein